VTLRVRIYSKKECHLCNEAKHILGRFASKYPLEIEEIDIEKDPAVFEQFHEEIPVIFLEETKLFKYKIDEKKFCKAIEMRLDSPQRSKDH